MNVLSGSLENGDTKLNSTHAAAQGDNEETSETPSNITTILAVVVGRVVSFVGLLGNEVTVETSSEKNHKGQSDSNPNDDTTEGSKNEQVKVGNQDRAD